MKSLWKLPVLFASLLSIMLAQPSVAADQVERLDADLCRALAKDGKIIPMMKLLELVKSLQYGQIVETYLIKANGRYVYEMEISNEQGQLNTLYVDAQSGEVHKNFASDLALFDSAERMQSHMPDSSSPKEASH